MDFFTTMQQELGLTLIIVILLLLKLSDGIKYNSTLFIIVDAALIVNLILGFYFNSE